MKRFVAIGTWSLMFGLVGLFLLTQVVAQTPPANPAPTSTTQTQPPVKAKTSAPAPRKPAAPVGSRVKKPTSSNSRDLPPLLVGLYIFLLAIFVGFELISKVPPTLHTPLMSGANAISGITIVGAMYCARHSSFSLASVLGFLAVICAMINVVGGFLVTDRMLKMFR